MDKTPRGRFAPSPSGRLHLGNMLSSLLAWLDIRSLGGQMLFRLEDLDPERSWDEYARLMAEDLRWLGLDWDLGWPEEPGCRQGLRTGRYEAAFERLSALGLVYALFGFLIPYCTLLMASFMRSVGNGFEKSNWTLRNYASLIKNDVAITALKNSLFLGAMTATCVVLLGLIAGYIIVRAKVRGRGVVEYLCNMPSGISGTALAMGLIFMYLSKPLNQLHLYGTIWLLLIAYITRMLPSGVRYCQSALIQIHTELEEASRISGASWGRTMRSVTVPLAKTGMLYAWILTFVMAFPELSSSVMLRNAGTDVVDLWDGAGGLPQAAAFGTVVFMLVTGLVLLAQKVTGRSMIDRT